MNECSKDPFLSEPGIFEDPYLLEFKQIINKRLDHINLKESILRRNQKQTLSDFCVYHIIFGLHTNGKEWLFREWAPNALSIHIIGDMTQWNVDERFALRKRRRHGIWEGRFPNDLFKHGDHYRLKMTWKHGEGDRIPTAATRVVQDPGTLIFNAQVWNPDKGYHWKHRVPETGNDPFLVYEAHIGMAQEEGRVGTYRDFEGKILPKIHQAGYNTLLLMAVQEHPYYGSLGYHVSSFYAPCSRFGTPEELKSLIDKAHSYGIRVLIDLVHSHAANNEVEGLSRFDGTLDQFFYPGEQGFHRLWDSRCFDYSKAMVLRFLLSNSRYWIDEFRIDGFRFDGVTSMLFKDHGLNRSFVSYKDYYNDNVDVDALAYLSIANKLIHELSPHAVTIAEDVSGYPGIAAPVSKGGTGFDFRYAMGIPDFWIRLLKEYRDEDWPLDKLWYELNSRRDNEKSISYAESHDQALVGDQTLMMRLMGKEIYNSMKAVDDLSVTTFRGVSLHKMIRLITIATAGNGYLNFMGNEFGHPEWIDFPSHRNNWSYHHARRQWSLKENKNLLFSRLAEFDVKMIQLAKTYRFIGKHLPVLLHLHQEDRVIAFQRGPLIFVFNFHDTESFNDYGFDAPPGKYSMVFNTDLTEFGGMNRLVPGQEHFTLHDPEKSGEKNLLNLYLPTRTALVLAPNQNRPFLKGLF